MHELAITESLVDCICENVGDARVVRVVIEIGKLLAVMPAAVRTCFEVCARSTPLEGAALDIVEVEGRARCRCCQAEITVVDILPECACGSVEMSLVSGEELRIRHVEVI